MNITKTQAAIAAFFERHSRAALSFSSGKDGAACLWLLQPWWDKVDVIWVNPGNPYPETVAYMAEIKRLVPHFYEVRGEQPLSILAHGWPVDTVPLRATPLGQTLGMPEAAPMRPFWDCCAENLWGPAEKFILRGDYSAVIRGQKNADRLKGPLRSGDVSEGIEYFYPIEDWCDADVFNYLTPARTPKSYLRGLSSSLDCKNCTAYTAENPGRLGDLQLIDPVAYSEVTAVHLSLRDCLRAQLESLEICHDHPTAL